MNAWIRNINDKIRNMPEWAFLIVYLGTLLCYKIIVGIQGFDMCDEGWVMSAYQQIFNDPTACEYNFLYYNTLLVGGVWNLLFSSLGYFGFRILGAICSTAIAYIVYLLLRNDINRWCIFVGVILFNLGYAMVFHHNGLTALVVALITLFLYKGLINSNKRWFLLAGIAVGINIFCRIPNVSMFSLVLVFIPYYMYTKDVRKTLTLVAASAIGVIIGVFCDVSLMFFMGHLQVFKESIASGLSAASASDSTHSLSKFLNIYIENYTTIFEQLKICLFIPVFIYFVNKFIINVIWRRIFLWIAILFYAIVLWRSVELTYIIYGFCFLIFTIYALLYPQDKNNIYLITIAAIVLFFLPFGSDFGVGNMGSSCIWIATPLAIGLLNKLLKERNTSTYRNARIFAYVFVFVLAGKTIYDTSLDCYFDHGSRLKKTARPKTVLASTYTTPEKAQQIDILLEHLEPLVKKNDYLLCYQYASTVHYLTETRPYLGNSAPWAYDSDNMKRQFMKAQNRIHGLPVIVRNKSAIAFWHKYAPDWNNLEADDQWNFNTNKIKLIQDFIRDNNYEIVWENEIFQILKPNATEGCENI